MTAAPAPVGSLQRRLALEHEAVWLTSLAAARFPALAERAEASYREHRISRDSLVARIGSAGATPVGPQPAYGSTPASADDARTRLADLADRLCAAALPLVTTGTPDDRTEALAGLRACALEAVDWGAAPAAFPGLG